MQSSIAKQIEALADAAAEQVRARIAALGLTPEQTHEVEQIIEATAYIVHIMVGLEDADDLYSAMTEMLNAK